MSKLYNNQKCIILMPIYNESEIIEEVLEQWIDLINKNNIKLLLIDDGSKDNTIEILNSKFSKYENIIIISKKNEGHGKTILMGYKFAIENNYNYVAQVDSDNQIKANEFYKILEFINGDYDLITGNRKVRNDPLIRVFLSKYILRSLLFFLFQKIIVDPNCPFRIMRKDFLSKFIKFNYNKNYIAPNILITIFAKKIKYVEIEHNVRISGEVTWKISKLFRFGLTLLSQLIKFRFTKFIF